MFTSSRWEVVGGVRPKLCEELVEREVEMDADALMAYVGVS